MHTAQAPHTPPFPPSRPPLGRQTAQSEPNPYICRLGAMAMADAHEDLI